MIKIKVSYENQQELDTILKILKPIVISHKVSKSNEGKFNKAYISIRSPT